MKEKSKTLHSPLRTTMRTLIAVLASFDSEIKHSSLVEAFESIYKHDHDKLERFHFLFTGGTFERIFFPQPGTFSGIRRMDDRVRRSILSRATRLPERREGGVTILANYVVRRQCGIVWPFLDPAEPHWLNPENLALMRLCDVWQVKRLMNKGSVEGWFRNEADKDITRNLQLQPPPLTFEDGTELAAIPGERKEKYFQVKLRDGNRYFAPKVGDTIALIAHDEMKAKMIDFVTQYETELSRFERILATGTTGREVKEASKILQNKVTPCRSGPKGGDIQIATEILAGRCHVVVFFVDPLHAHPHAEDIRVVFGACMIENNVQMLTNEVHAREWMDHVRIHGSIP